MMKPENIFSRRTLLMAGVSVGSALVGGVSLPLVSGSAMAATTSTFGNMVITILSDGNLVLPLNFSYPDAPQDELKTLLEKAGALKDEAIMPDCNVTLVKMGDKTILFDVGAGANFMPSAGKLGEQMEKSGIDPASITDVVFTHAHPDHLWGLLDDFDELHFPDANYHMNEVEWDYWTASDTLEKTPEARKTFVVGAQSRLEMLSDRVTRFRYGAEVLPGIEAVDTSGHTPGHTSFMLHEGSESLLVLGDAITQSTVSFERPDWPSGSDQDAQKGIETRKKLLDRLVADKSGLIGFHLPHPGIGRAEKADGAYRFVAEAN